MGRLAKTLSASVSTEVCAKGPCCSDLYFQLLGTSLPHVGICLMRGVPHHILPEGVSNTLATTTTTPLALLLRLDGQREPGRNSGRLGETEKSATPGCSEAPN